MAAPVAEVVAEVVDVVVEFMGPVERFVPEPMLLYVTGTLVLELRLTMLAELRALAE